MSSSEEEFVEGEEEEEEEEEEEFVADEEESDGDDDLPLSALKKPAPSTAAVAAASQQGESDSDDDDIPLAALKSPETKKKEAAKKKKKEAAATKKKKSAKVPAAKKKTVAKAKSKTISKKTKKSASASTPSKSSAGYKSASGAMYIDGCRKGQIIQHLLCRWWYAIQWPALESTVPPPHYDALDGMPGVFIATSGNHVGQILDKRDKSKCPNFANLMKKSSSELQELLLKALEGQKKALLEAEGSGTDIEKEIEKTIKWAQKIKPDAADKEATKILKAAKIALS
jgi:hypothetical protein